LGFFGRGDRQHGGKDIVRDIVELVGESRPVRCRMNS
jgi:hypothetical protein